MIVVKIELWPSNGGDPREVGRAIIANDGTGSERAGNYDVALCHSGIYYDPHRVWKSGHVKNFWRGSSPYRLVELALQSALHQIGIKSSAKAHAQAHRLVQIARLRETAAAAAERPIVGKTADGVDVRIGDRVWFMHGIKEQWYAGPNGTAHGLVGKQWSSSLDHFYSTEAAAREADAAWPFLKSKEERPSEETTQPGEPP